jgi:hypothetical protein
MFLSPFELCALARNYTPRALSNHSRIGIKHCYSLVEAGVAYVVGVNRFISALRFTVSYRAQILNTRGYQLIGANGYTAPNERDFTQGPTVGVSGSF